MEMVDKFLTKMYKTNADFVFTVTRDFVRNLPDTQHVPLESAHGTRSARGAADTFVPPGTSAGRRIG